MPKAFTPQIVSANTLLEGDVVYLDRAHGWTRALAEAAVAHSADEALALLKAAAQPARVVDPYLADVALDPVQPPRPLHYREVFRTRGPSNRPDLGRQAERL
jgi:hypothetical protein